MPEIPNGDGAPGPITADLVVRVGELTEQSELLTEAVRQLRPRVEKAERVSFRTAIAAAVLLCLVVVLGWVAADQKATANRLDGVVQQSLCPLYALIVGSYDPSTRPVGQARDKYDHAFDVMRQAYTNLGCTDALVPPRTGS